MYMFILIQNDLIFLFFLSNWDGVPLGVGALLILRTLLIGSGGTAPTVTVILTLHWVTLQFKIKVPLPFKCLFCSPQGCTWSKILNTILLLPRVGRCLQNWHRTMSTVKLRWTMTSGVGVRWCAQSVNPYSERHRKHITITNGCLLHYST